jgi:hypothetical protein
MPHIHLKLGYTNGGTGFGVLF